MYRQAKFDEPIIFELSKEGRRAYLPPKTDVPTRPINIPEKMLRKTPPDLPQLSEGEVMRHYIRLSQMNYSVDVGTYPLGSCTMKYNPKINEAIVRSDKFMYLHPLQPQETVQGLLQILYDLQKSLTQLAGLPYCSLQPAAGAQGEFTGLALIRAYHLDHGDNKRDEIIVPDSSHGTNPASSTMNGFKVITIESNADGQVDLKALKAAISERTAGFMITNPNTLGIFEANIKKIAKIVKDAGGLLYYDGANFNAIMAKVRPGDMGFDVVHFNLHKTFSTPHGGGGPGAGAICCSEELKEYLPVPTIEYDKKRNFYYLNYDLPKTIGKVHSFYGNIGVCLKAYAYIAALGAEGLKTTAEHAVLVSNYLMRKLEKIEGLKLSHNPSIPRKHEFVLEATPLKHHYDISAMDIAKLLINRGIHAPTVYFPLIVHEALMIEPTENENKDRLDQFAAIMEKEIEKAKKDPEYAHKAPYWTAVGRVDDAYAVKNLTLSWKMIKEKQNREQTDKK